MYSWGKTTAKKCTKKVRCTCKVVCLFVCFANWTYWIFGCFRWPRRLALHDIIYIFLQTIDIKLTKNLLLAQAKSVHSILWFVKIWQVSSCWKLMQHLETCLLIAEADRVLCHLVMVFFNPSLNCCLQTLFPLKSLSLSLKIHMDVP